MPVWSSTQVSSMIASLRSISWNLAVWPIPHLTAGGTPYARTGQVCRFYRRGGGWPPHPSDVGRCRMLRLGAEQADRCRLAHCVVPGRDAQLAVDRFDLGLNRVSGEE